MWDVEVNLDFVQQKERNNVSLKLLTKLEDHFGECRLIKKIVQNLKR